MKLIIYVGGEQLQEGEFAPGEYIAGRSHSADIHLPEPDISGKHLKFVVSETGASVENLSSHGAGLRNTPIEKVCNLKDGDIISLGKRTEIRVALPDTAASADRQSETVIPSAPCMSPAPEDRHKTRIPGAPRQESAPEPGKEVPPEDDNVLKTDVMRTRLASLEELNLLRHADRKRSTGKLFKYIAGIIGAVVLLALLYSIKSSPKETNLTWPVDSVGTVLGAFTDPGNGGHQAGGFSLAYPNIKGKTLVEQKPELITVNTWFGKDASVPLRIMFIPKTDPDFLTRERKAVFAAMLADLQQDNRHWNFSQISDVFFIGSENGLPCLSVEYRRESDQESWYGEILFFRTGNQAFMRLAETVATERARGQDFISNTPFVRFSPLYLQSHWEGDSSYKGGDDTAVLLDEISRHLSKQAPFEWARTYLLLQHTLTIGTQTENPALTQEALVQLRRLRNLQTTWYNSQKIQYNAAKLNNDRHRESAILELCKTVFSSPDDLRYFTLRRNLWE